MLTVGKIFSGIEVWADKLIVTPTFPHVCYLISLFGREMEVKSVSASFLDGETLDDRTGYLEEKGEDRTFIRDSWHYAYAVKARKSRTPGGAEVLHQIIYAPDAFKRIIFYKNETEAIDKVFTVLDNSYTTPLWEGWKKEIYEWMKKNGYVEEAITYGIDEQVAIIGLPAEEMLEDFIRSL